jgi:hypothetical protein
VSDVTVVDERPGETPAPKEIGNARLRKEDQRLITGGPTT